MTTEVSASLVTNDGLTLSSASGVSLTVGDACLSEELHVDDKPGNCSGGLLLSVDPPSTNSALLLIALFAIFGASLAEGGTCTSTWLSGDSEDTPGLCSGLLSAESANGSQLLDIIEEECRETSLKECSSTTLSFTCVKTSSASVASPS